MLEELNKILLKLPAELQTTRAIQVQEFAAQLLRLLTVCHKHVAKWEDIPGAPRLFFASALWVVKSDTPSMRSAGDSTPRSGLCTEALKLLRSVHDYNGFLDEEVHFDFGDKLVMDVVMDVLQQGSDPDARSAAFRLLGCMTAACSSDFADRLWEWGTVAFLVDAIISGSPFNCNADAVWALSSICDGAYGAQQKEAWRSALRGLIPVLVAMVVARPDAANDHIRLLDRLCDCILDDDGSECVEAGAVPAVVAYMRVAYMQAKCNDDIEDAVQLLARLSANRASAVPFLSCGGVQTLVSCLTCADEDNFKEILVCLGNTFKHIMKRGVKSEMTVIRSYCLKEGVLCQVKRRQRQLKHDSALAYARQDVGKLTKHLKRLMGSEVRMEELAFFTRAEKARAACYLMEHTPEERLRSMLLDWGMLRLLCETLTDNEAFPPSRVPRWHHWRASAWALHVLVDRLLRAKASLAGNSSPGLHAAGGWQLATGATSPPTDPDEAVMHCTVPGSMLRGEQPWTNVKVVVEGRPYHMLQEVLCRASPVFRTMLEGSFRENGAPEIVLGEIGCDEWTVVLQHMYTGSVDVPAALVEQVLAVAEMYGLRKLKGACQELLIKELDVSNAPLLFELSVKHYAELLKHRCMLRMLKHWAADADFTATASSAAGVGEAADTGSPEKREAHVDKELRRKVAADLLLPANGAGSVFYGRW